MKSSKKIRPRFKQYEALIKVAEERRDASLCYEKAYSLCPDNPKYALHYAN